MNLNLPLPVRILVIDDDKDYFENTLENQVKLLKMKKKIQICLDHAGSSEEGKELFKKNEESSHYNGVIIDYWGVKEKGGTKEESGAFLDLITYFANKNIAKAVITGHKSKQKEVGELCRGNYDLYFKGSSDSGEEKMLTDLWYKIQDSEEAKIVNDYSEVFKVFNDFHDDKTSEDNRNKLIKCIKNMDSSIRDDIEDNLTRLRKIQENIYRELNKADPNLVSDDNLGPPIDFEKIMYALYDKGLHKHEIIGNFSWNIRKFSNAYGAHTKDPTKYKETPTKYTVQALTYMMFDLILWFKEVVDELE
jgi:hypothetical protein